MILDTMDLQPGAKRILLQYQIPYGGTEYLLTKSFHYPTTAFYVLAPSIFGLSGDDLLLEGPLDLQGRQYMALGRETVPPGSEVTVVIGQLPLVWTGYILIAVLGAVVAGLAGGTIYLMVRKRKGRTPQGEKPKDESARQSGEDLEARRNTLLSLLAHLDDQFEAKQVTETVYREMRAELKGKLKEIMRKSA